MFRYEVKEFSTQHPDLLQENSELFFVKLVHNLNVCNKLSVLNHNFSTFSQQYPGEKHFLKSAPGIPIAHAGFVGNFLHNKMVKRMLAWRALKMVVFNRDPHTLPMAFAFHQEREV